MKDKFWKDKTILITGASSGIGEAILQLLKPIVGKIYLISRKPPEGYDSSESRIAFFPVDLSNPESVEKGAQDIRKSLLAEGKGLDVLFNNAGITAHGRFDATDMSVFRKTFETNFFGPIRLVQTLHEFLTMAKGAVVSTSTVSGLYGVPGRAAYSSSKSALHAAMEAYRIEMMETGVRSIIVCPPYTKTNLRTSGLDAQGNVLDEPQAGSKIKSPLEVAYAIVHAVEKPDSRLVTIDKSGIAMKVLRLFSPKTLEKIMFKKLYKDFH